jgi:hypothetical protein
MIPGKHFNKKSDLVYVQCRFNNEILTTDPVRQSTEPIWDTELAWNITHKQLSFLRSSRATLKLQVYSINQTQQREPLGYVILDIRAAVQGSPPYPEKWYPLINSRGPFRPEMKISFVVSSERTSLVSEPLKTSFMGTNRNSPMRLKSFLKTVTTLTDSVSPSPVPMMESRIPILFTNGYFQIGTFDIQQPFFTLWITISFAEYVSILDSRHHGSFTFSYTFFGMDIQTNVFTDLQNPNFPAEQTRIVCKAYPKEKITSVFKTRGRNHWYL